MILSIIVPFYNSMPYLNDLLTSMKKNNINELHNIEVIFVNDGSTDDYASVLAPFLSENSNVLLITTENHGVSSAKNTGLYNAKGDYIWFVDSDDIIPDNILTIILKNISEYKESPDIIFANYSTFDDITGKIEEKKFAYDQVLSEITMLNNMDPDIMEVLFHKLKIPYSIWYQLFRKDFLLVNKIFFREDLSISEDFDFKFQSLSKAQIIGYLLETIYIYRLPNKNRKSLSVKQPTPEMYVKVGQMYIKWYEYYFNEYLLSHKNGDQFISQKISFLIYSIDKYLDNIDHNNIHPEYNLFHNKSLEISQKNELYIKNIISLIKKGDYSSL